MTQQRTYAALRQLLIPSNSTLCLGLKRRAKTDPTPIPTRKKVTAEYKSYSSFVAPSIKSRSFARKEFCLARRLRFAGYDLHLRSAATIRHCDLPTDLPTMEWRQKPAPHHRADPPPACAPDPGTVPAQASIPQATLRTSSLRASQCR